ncbi:hypothetical protein YN1_5210 [Nanoarchaeota archaeon]
MPIPNDYREKLLERLNKSRLTVSDLNYIIKNFFRERLDNILNYGKEYKLRSYNFYCVNMYYDEGRFSIYKEDKVDYISTIGIMIYINKRNLINIITSELFIRYLLEGKIGLSIIKYDGKYNITIVIPTIYGEKNIKSGPYILMNLFRDKLLNIYSSDLYLFGNKLKIVQDEEIYGRIYIKPARYPEDSSKLDEIDMKMFRADNISLRTYNGEERYNVILSTYKGIVKLMERYDYEEYDFYQGIRNETSIIISSVKIRNMPEFVLVDKVYKEGEKYIVEAYRGNRELIKINKKDFCYHPLAGLYGINYCK